MERFRGVRATRPAGNAPGPVSLHSSNLEPLMSALGQKRTLRHVCVMSALPPKADIVERDRHVRFVPKADSCSAAILSLFDHLVGEGEQFGRYIDIECFGDVEIDDQLELSRLQHR